MSTHNMHFHGEIRKIKYFFVAVEESALSGAMVSANKNRSCRYSLSQRMTKRTKWQLRPTKTQISLGICPV